MEHEVQKEGFVSRSHVLWSLFCLALFFFVFLSAEYTFDASVAVLAGPSHVAIYESCAVGASVAGFASYAVAERWFSSCLQAICLFMGMLSVVCFIVCIASASLFFCVMLGGVSFFAMGYIGAQAHAGTARALAGSAYLARSVAFAYACGVLIQVICHMVFSVSPIQSALTVLAQAVLVLLLFVGSSKSGAAVLPEESIAPRIASPIPFVRFIVAMVCLTGIFAALNAALTTAHAQGAIDLGAWPRVVLVVSALLAGFLLDFRSRTYADIAMTCVAMVSTLSLFILMMGGGALEGTIVFYLGSGFFVVFFTMTSMDLAVRSASVSLWASMGRMINNAVALLITAPVMAPIGSQNVLATVCLAILLFVGIAVSLLAGTGLRGSWGISPEKKTSVSLSPDDPRRMQAFGDAWGFTAREQEVLGALIASDGSVQDVAQGLYISRTTLYRHISSMTAKTQTKSRAELVHLFYVWDGSKH